MDEKMRAYLEARQVEIQARRRLNELLPPVEPLPRDVVGPGDQAHTLRGEQMDALIASIAASAALAAASMDLQPDDQS